MVVQLWLLYCDSLVIDHSVVLTQDEIRDPQGPVTAHLKCAFNGQEMAVLQNRSNAGTWRKREGEMCELRWEVQGETAGKLILCLLCQRSLGFR